MQRPWLVVLLAALGACGPRVSRLEPLAGLEDGEVITADGPIRLAVVGAMAPAEADADALAAAVHATSPDLVLLTGDQVRRSTERQWRRVHAWWQHDTVLAATGTGERRGDPTRRGMAQVYADQGADDFGGPVPFTHADLVSDGVRWRVVVLDAHRRKLGDRWLDQGFWVPKVVRPGVHDRLLVVVSAPLVSLSDPRRADPDGAVSTLLGLVTEYADPTALMAVVMGGTHANELHLPGGPFGEAHVVAGTAAAPASDLWHRGTSDVPGRAEVALAEEFDAAMREAMAERVRAGLAGPLSVERMHREAFPSDVLPVRGWWTFTLDGTDLSLEFHLEDATGTWSPAFATRFGPTGWAPLP